MSDTDYSPPAKFLVPLKCRKKRKCSLSENIQEVTEGVQSEKKKFKQEEEDKGDSAASTEKQLSNVD